MWDLIASVPDLCILFTITRHCICKLIKMEKIMYTLFTQSRNIILVTYIQSPSSAELTSRPVSQVIGRVPHIRVSRIKLQHVRSMILSLSVDQP